MPSTKHPGVETGGLGPVAASGPAVAGATALEPPLAAEHPAPAEDQLVDGENGWRNRIVGHVVVDPRTLIPHPQNWRVHPEGQARVLGGVLAEVGIVQQVIRNVRTGRLVDGHLRVKLAVQSGVRRLPVVDVDLSEEEERVVLATFDPITGLADADAAVLTALIAQTAAADPAVQDLLETMRRAADPTYDPDASIGAGENLDGEDAPVEVDPVEAEPDRADELCAKWGTQAGQLWLIGSVALPGRLHRLIVGDCTDRRVMARLCLAEQAFDERTGIGSGVNHVGVGTHPDLVWVDPPYGVDYVGKTMDALTLDGDGAAGLRALLEAFMRQATEVCRPGCPYYLCHADKTADLVRAALAAQGWLFRQNLIWVKDVMVLSGADYHPRHEPIAYGTLPGASVGRMAAKDASKRGVRNWHGPDNATTVFEVDRPTRSEEHPTMKPPALVAEHLRNSCPVGGVVLDAFLGSGATMAAAEQTGRLCCGVEIDPRYAAVTLERMDRAGCAVRIWRG